MRKMLTGLGLAVCLTLAPVAAANAETPAQIAQSQLNPSPQPDYRSDEGGGNGGLWGLLGLLGLLGLAGMRKQRSQVGTAEHVTRHRPEQRP